MSRLFFAAQRVFANRGFVVQRHPAVRRQAMLRRHQVGVVFDVGAARGSYGLQLRQFGYEGDIVSFEPLQAAYTELATTSKGDPLWSIVHSALGEEQGRKQINVASNSDSSSLLPLGSAHSDAAPDVRYVGTEVVDISRFDDHVIDHLAPGTGAFLKIDTQGFERQVLSGASGTLPRLAGLELELSFTPLYDGGMLADEAIAFAYDAGFELTSFAQGFTHRDGQLLQGDGVFFRREVG